MLPQMVGIPVMRLILEPTEDFFLTDDNGPVRAWVGKTGLGTR